MAAYFATKGYSTSLYAREEERVAMFPQDNIFHIHGIMDAEVKVDLISADMCAVLEDAFLIMVTTPSHYHHIIAKVMAPCLKDGQIIVLNPGRTFGSYSFAKDLAENGCTANYILGEADTFAFACRCEIPGEPYIYSFKNTLQVATLNPADNQVIVDALSPLFRNVVALPNTLHTGFGNIGMIFHPLPVLMNITRIEAKERFLYYVQGISPLVAGTLEKIDAERLAVAKAYGVTVPSAFEWMKLSYDTHGDTLYERIQNNPGYADIYAPTNIYSRYVLEDVPTGCVPVYYAGQAAGIETPSIKALIDWACLVYGEDFYKTGRNSHKIDFDAIYKKINA